MRAKRVMSADAYLTVEDLVLLKKIRVLHNNRAAFACSQRQLFVVDWDSGSVRHDWATHVQG